MAKSQQILVFLCISILFIPFTSHGQPLIDCKSFKKSILDIMWLQYPKKSNPNPIILGKHAIEWTEEDLDNLVKLGQKCLESDKFLNSEVQDLRRSIPRILKGIEEAKTLYAENKNEASSFTKSLFAFNEKLDSLSLEASNNNGYSYDDKMNLLRELKNIYSKKPSSFNVDNNELTEITLSQKISQRINEINSKAHDLEKEKLKEAIVSTSSYKQIEQKKPGAVNFELLVREGINDTGLTLGTFVSCAEITNSESKVNVNYSMFNKSIAISNLNIDNQVFEATVALKELDGTVLVQYIELSGRKFESLREKLGIIKIIVSGCDRGLLTR